MANIEEWARAHLWTFASTFSWLALTLYLGIREQWRVVEHMLGGGGIRENTGAGAREMLEENPTQPRQDPDDGLWYAPTYDPQTGQRNGKRRVDAPSAPRLGGNSARLGMFNR